MPDLEPITREEKLLDGEDLTPITRKEQFIKRIYDKTQEIPEPITREEMFLKKAGEGGGGDIDLQTLNVTENGTVNAPSGVAYNKVVTNVPLPENAYLLKEVANLPQPIASFSDGTDNPLKSLTASIVPVQDLHGYDAPWVGGAGKNKLPMTVDGIKSANTSGTWSGNSYVLNGVTFTIQTDSGGNVIGIQANGLASADARLEVGTYTAEGLTISGNGCPSNGSTRTYYLAFTYMGNDTGDGRSNQTIDSGNLVIATVTIKSGYNASNLVYYPMIRLASAPSNFEPYSNICPISGWTEEIITRTGKNLIDVSKLAQQVVTSRGDLRPGVPVKLQAGSYTISAQSGTLPFYITRPANNYSYITIDALPFTFSLDNEEEVIVRIAQPDISSWDYVNLQLETGSTATAYEPYNGTTTTIPFTDGQGNPVEVYGGSVDVVNGGEQPSTLGVVDLDNATMTTTNNRCYYNGVKTLIKVPTSQSVLGNYMAEKYKQIPFNGTLVDGEYAVGQDGVIIFYYDGVNKPTGKLVYELATPTTFYTHPTSIKSLDGENNVSASTGQIEELEFFAKEA